MRIALALTAALSFAACSSSGKTVTRTDEEIDLSGEWNDTDADRVAKSIVEDCLSHPWAREWAEKNARKPVIRLYPIKNKTDGYIDYRYFTKQIEFSLIRSGSVEVVSSLEEAETAREEREDQAANASEETATSHGNEVGSDFVLTGWLIAQNDQEGKKAVKAYLTSLEIVDVSTQKKAWVGQKRIKKLVVAGDE